MGMVLRRGRVRWRRIEMRYPAIRALIAVCFRCLLWQPCEFEGLW